MSIREATCPLCGLLCDDLGVEVDGQTVRVVRGACERGRLGFERLGAAAVLGATARVAGRSSSLDAAIDAAADLLRGARRPLIGGLDVDVAGMRATLALARRIGAVIDHSGGATKYRNLHVLQEAGGISTTFAETRNRADLVVLVGDGWHRRFPRFIERIVAPAPVLAAVGSVRRIVTMNVLDADAKAALPGNASLLPLNAPLAALPTLFAMLGALVEGRPADPARLSGVAPEALSRCVEWLLEARYGVFVWAAADLDWPHAELAVQALARLIRSLNVTTRFAGLPLAGNDGDLTANAVQTWQAGVPLPASYASGRVDFDPHRFALHEVLSRGEADALIWVSSLSGANPPAVDGLPRIVLGRADTQPEPEPEVFVPVATPGVDAAGHLLRGDKVVTLRLPQLREGGPPPVAQVIEALSARLG